MNVPELRFPEFSGDWEEKKLGEIVTLMQSGLSRKLEGKDIGLPVLRSNNLIDNNLDLSDIRYWYDIDDKGANLENYFLKEGDLLVNFINSIKQIGKTAIYNGELKRKAIFTTNIMRLNFNSNTDVFFIHNYFQTKKYLDYIQSITKPAVNQASFTTVDFKRFKLNVSSLDEQQKIASFLSKIDEKIEKLEKKQNLWETYKKGIMQQIFSQKLRFKDENGENYPDWEEKTLEKIANIFKGHTPSTGKSEYWNGGVLWLSIADMKDKYITKTSRTISKKACEGKRIMPRGSLIMSFKLTIGRLGIIKEEMYSNEAICNFDWKNKKINTEYMYYNLNSIDIRKFGSQAAKGMTLNNDSLKSIIVELPVVNEQEKIAIFLSTIDSKIESLAKELDINMKFKKGLLQQMFC